MTNKVGYTGPTGDTGNTPYTRVINTNNTYQNFTWSDICNFSALKNSGYNSLYINFYVKSNITINATFIWSVGLTRTTINE